MVQEAPITLKEVQLRLGVPQHILIHLCEKGVIEPDFAETSGRGKRREFSQRNLFEFAVALALRKFELPVAMTAFVIRVLRQFARTMSKLSPRFEFQDFLNQRGTHLILYLYDGDFLIFSAQGSTLNKSLLLGVKINDGVRPKVESLDKLPRGHDAHLEINLSQIASKLSK